MKIFLMLVMVSIFVCRVSISEAQSVNASFRSIYASEAVEIVSAIGQCPQELATVVKSHGARLFAAWVKEEDHKRTYMLSFIIPSEFASHEERLEIDKTWQGTELTGDLTPYAYSCKIL